ncbi:MAG TPA: tetratricopeptide repeat protein [Candidatus Latescibacteria bacterium]|nr:tetratricopeptide repeat protein [Candidatus Latescibacterota bacterium]
MNMLLFLTILCVSIAYAGLPDRLAFREAWSLRYAGKLDQAAGLLQDLLSAYPKGPEADDALLLLGGIMEEKGNLGAALKYYRLLLQRFPESPYAEEASFQIAYISLLSRDFVGAFAEFLSFERNFPQSPLVPLAEFHMGKALYALGHFYGAEERFSEFLRLAPDHPLAPKAWFHLGLCYQALDRTQEAAEVFWYILRTFPKHLVYRQAAFRLGEVYFRSGRFYLAIGAFQRAAQEEPDSLSDEALLYIERARYQLGQYRDPIDPARQFVRKYPDRTLAGELQVEIGRYYEAGYDIDRAIQAYRQVLASPRWKAQHPEALLGVARCLKRKGRREEAIAVLKAIIGEYSGDEALRALLMRASLYREAEALDSAVADYEEVLDRTGGEGEFALEALHGLGTCYETLSRWPETARVYRRILNEFPEASDRGEVALNLARAYAEGGKLRQALDALQRALREPLSPSQRAEALVCAGELAVELNEEEEAEEYFREALRCGSDREHPGALLGLARLALARGDTAKALPLLREAAAGRSSYSEEAKKWLDRLQGE